MRIAFIEKTIIYPAELPDDMWGIEDSTILYLPSDVNQFFLYEGPEWETNPDPDIYPMPILPGAPVPDPNIPVSNTDPSIPPIFQDGISVYGHGQCISSQEIVHPVSGNTIILKVIEIWEIKRVLFAMTPQSAGEIVVFEGKLETYHLEGGFFGLTPLQNNYLPLPQTDIPKHLTRPDYI